MGRPQAWATPCRPTGRIRRPGYTVAEEEEELRRWRSGEKRPAAELYTAPYLVKVRDHARAGRRMRRVHTVTSPLSEHLRFQCEWEYAFSVQAGEEVLSPAEYERRHVRAAQAQLAEFPQAT